MNNEIIQLNKMYENVYFIIFNLMKFINLLIFNKLNYINFKKLSTI